MSDRTPIPLTPTLVGLQTSEFKTICEWPFADPFVARLLQNDIPQRVQYGNCRIWLYRDSQCQPVGFGTLDLCEDYRDFSGGRIHPYIPLLAVNPTIPSLGYGTTIIQHLTDEVALLVRSQSELHDRLYLDVYTSSEKAIRLYTKSGFIPITPDPIADPDEDGKSYIVMAKCVSIAAN